MHIENSFRTNEEYDEIKTRRVRILYVYRMHGHLLTFLLWSVIFVIEAVHPGVCSDEVVCCFVRFQTDLRFTVRVVDSNPMLYLYNTTNVIHFNIISF